MKKIYIIFYVFLVLLPAAMAQNYSIDLSGIKESYSIGDKIEYTVLLLEDNNLIQRNVDVIFSDELGQNKITQKVITNSKNSLVIGENFSALNWQITTSYNNKEVKRSFLVLESSKVEFSIEGDKLIIKNKGNIRYTRSVQIKIGGETTSYTQNIPIGGEKKWTLIAPAGSYNIEVTDGISRFIKSNVKLTGIGTGNAIGAISEDFPVTGLLGGPIDPEKSGNTSIFSGKSAIAITFVLAVFALGILIFVSNKIKKR